MSSETLQYQCNIIMQNILRIDPFGRFCTIKDCETLKHPYIVILMKLDKYALLNELNNLYLLSNGKCDCKVNDEVWVILQEYIHQDEKHLNRSLQTIGV